MDNLFDTFNYIGLDGKKRKIEIPVKAVRIHISFGSDLSDKGIYLNYQFQGDWKVHVLSRTMWMTNLNHFTTQLHDWLEQQRLNNQPI